MPSLPGLPPLPDLRIPLPMLVPNVPAPPATEADLKNSFDKAAKRSSKKTPGSVGIAITPVNSDETMSFGSVRTARAWSTLKVPVSIAAERANGAAVDDDVRKAIRKSDNDAAERLWDSLGGGARAVDGVTAVLREAHDVKTHVDSELDHPRSYPGYTHWRLAQQAVFGAHLQCLPDSGPVLDHMREVEANQKWGMKNVRKRGVTTAVKGGWGPATDATGKYVVRQLSVVTTPRGAFAVSMAALPTSGSFSDGTVMLNRIGKWVGDNMDVLPTGLC
ncbi:hypothetical protein [Gordonia zhaorongruii]|nr:hypothetical protein [Gordonia zhaorongruii]